jgi:hypothetical protein
MLAVRIADDLAQARAQDIVSFIEHRPGGGRRNEHVGTHADLLGALAREQKRSGDIHR